MTVTFNSNSIFISSILKKPVNKVILRYFPPGMEMSFYSLVSSIIFYVIYLCWLPITDYKLWDIQIWWLYYGVIGERACMIVYTYSVMIWISYNPFTRTLCSIVCETLE